ncbi:PREDICTED: nucleoprotein TPR-like isoform X2 [Populus euphratica]|uniref:Nucleoprotein TPR-like isoform X2 n=1 Tax=Populus euphratica TaxID=75702 RepID=A0AAJ6UIW4_POPEU|nr:PREDICTED: nucleoprotein TPR-like isoform X2 [Populus euphratica]
MDTNLNDKESMIARIQQLEHERGELHKDIEQLCLQQAGPGYLAAATRMHFQRTAGLEQEIENLKKQLAACSRDNLNLQEELSEAYRIKTQLAKLHQAEAAKNMEAEKQVKFFQGCVAAAFADRDNSIMEAEKAKEKEESKSQKFSEIQQRLEVLNSDFLEQKRLNDTLQSDLSKQDEQIETFKKVVNKFYEIRQHSLEGFEDTSWDNKCACLLHDSEELWSYNDSSTSKYISALEEEVETLRNSLDKLQSKIRVGLEIENHLKKKVLELEKKQVLLDKMVMEGITELHHYHSRHRVQITSLLSKERSHIKSIIDMAEEKMKQFDVISEQDLVACRVVRLQEDEFRDVHMSTDADLDLAPKRIDQGALDTVAHSEGNTSEALAQAMQEKVAALLLLSQQEERHLLERNVNAALQKKIEELQRNLLQVTNEKVKALMELAQLKLEYQQLQKKVGSEIKGDFSADTGEIRLSNIERDGKIRNLLKRTYLRRWMGTMDFRGNEAQTCPSSEGNFSGKRANDMDFARMKIENATLKESMECMDHLISSIHRLHLALLKVKESDTREGTSTGLLEALNDIISEARLVKTALGSSLPISWSAEADDASIGESVCDELSDIYGNPSREKIDSVSAAGFEMVELLILAAQILKDNKTTKGC